MKKLVFLVFVAFHFLNFSQSESSKNVDAKTIQDQSKKLKRAIDDKNDVASAESLLRLGETFEKKGDYKKSETYYQQALNIYEKENF